MYFTIITSYHLCDNDIKVKINILSTFALTKIFPSTLRLKVGRNKSDGAYGFEISLLTQIFSLLNNQYYIFLSRIPSLISLIFLLYSTKQRQELGSYSCTSTYMIEIVSYMVKD